MHLIEPISAIVQQIAVELARRHERLDGVAVGRVGYDQPRREERERTPQEGRHRLHAQHERVARQVARVRHAVFFPELPEEVLAPGHAGVVNAEVAFEEEVDCAACEVG